LGQPSLLWVWHWKIPLKIPNFSIVCPSDQKKSHRVGPLIARQKYASLDVIILYQIEDAQLTILLLELQNLLEC